MRARVSAATWLALSLMASTAVTACAAADDPRDLSGVYWASEFHPQIQVFGGGELPLTEAGKAAYARDMAGRKDGSIEQRARKDCTPAGIPRSLATPYPFHTITPPPGQI